MYIQVEVPTGETSVREFTYIMFANLRTLCPRNYVHYVREITYIILRIPPYHIQILVQWRDKESLVTQSKLQVN